MRSKFFAPVLATLALVTAAVAGSGTASAQPYGIDMHLACQVTHGTIGWRATLAYPAQGGWGWRCYSVPISTGYKSVDIEKYCWNVYGLHARGGSTAYNWRCDY
ncbi:hypothetical protein [Nocardia sp. NPDC057353]|uniref:hypothetical protein n=1 Tax=Nocardia sp. NPDC057353 TaxID=3346104 RepID=UPI00362B6A58